MSYRKEEIKAGFVVLTALLIFSAMVVFIGGSRFWSKLETYRIRFSAIGGLEKGAAVRLGGLRVGRVTEISVADDDDSRIEVVIGLKSGTPVHRGVLAGINTLGLVGDYYVLLTPKQGAVGPLAQGSLIPSRSMVEIGDLLVQAGELSRTLNSSVEEVAQAVSQILSDDNIQSVQIAIQGLSRLTTRSEQSLSTITSEVQDVLAGLDTLVSHVDGLVLENRDQVRETLGAIKDSVDRINTLSLAMNDTLSENREGIHSTVVALRKDTEKTGQLIDNLNGRVSVTGDYLEETMGNLLEISENLRLLSSQLKRQPWRLIYKEAVR
jgi:virulence factor Mce-like protein